MAMKNEKINEIYLHKSLYTFYYEHEKIILKLQKIILSPGISLYYSHFFFFSQKKITEDGWIINNMREKANIFCHLFMFVMRGWFYKKLAHIQEKILM